MMHRRDFVQVAAGAGAWGAMAGGAAAAPTTGMFLALSSALTGNKVQWPEFARLAARVGYGGTDLNLGGATKEGLDATRGLLAELKIRTSFCSLDDFILIWIRSGRTYNRIKSPTCGNAFKAATLASSGRSGRSRSTFTRQRKPSGSLVVARNWCHVIDGTWTRSLPVIS